jgi:hypothetical protein
MLVMIRGGVAMDYGVNQKLPMTMAPDLRGA